MRQLSLRAGRFPHIVFVSSRAPRHVQSANLGELCVVWVGARAPVARSLDCPSGKTVARDIARTSTPPAAKQRDGGYERENGKPSQ